jgi:hypothetical protein
MSHFKVEDFSCRVFRFLGRRKSKHQQWLTEDIGHPALQKHLAILIAFMRASPTWAVFHRNVERALPKLGEIIPLALDED